MPLDLQPSYSTMTREQIEEHLTQVRLRRLQASIVFHEGQNVKFGRQLTVLDRRIQQQYEMLGKEIARLDQLDEKIMDRLVKLESLQQEAEMIKGLVT